MKLLTNRNGKLLVLLFTFSLSMLHAQTIEFNNKIDELINPSKNLTHFEDGFVDVSTFRITLFNEKTNTLIEKEWKKINTQLCKFDDDFSFLPTFCAVTNNQIKVAINWRGKKFKQIILCTFDMDLNLVDEKVIAEIAYYNEKDKKNWALSFHKSPKNNFYIFSQVLEFKPEAGKGDNLEYYVLNDQFEIIRQGKVDLPKPISKDYYRNDKNVGSIFCLDEGDPIINYDGMLFLLGEKDALQVNFDLDYSIHSYKILNLDINTIALIGSYSNEKNSGIAVIKLRPSDLEQMDQYYIPLSSEFDLTADVLYEAMLSGKRPEQTKSNAKPLVFDAQLDKKGNIRVVLIGYNTQNGSPNLNNIDILGISKNGELLFEKVIAKRYMNIEDLEVIFTEDKTIIFAEDHTSNFNDGGSFLPDKKTNYDELASGKLINHFIVYDHSEDKFTNRVIDFKGSNSGDYNNKLMTVKLIKASSPFEKYYIISRYQPNNTNFGKFGNVYTLIGTIKY